MTPPQNGTLFIFKLKFTANSKDVGKYLCVKWAKSSRFESNNIEGNLSANKKLAESIPNVNNDRIVRDVYLFPCTSLCFQKFIK